MKLLEYKIVDSDNKCYTILVNGQTGKVSVRALKDSHYYFLPWWLKAAAATVIFTLAVFGALRLFGMDEAGALLIAGALALFFIIVTLCLYSDTVHNKFAVVSGRKIFTSGGNIFRREFGNLVLRDEILERRTQPPVFFERIVIPRSRSRSISSSTCACISRWLSVFVFSKRRSARVLLPWSMCAIIQKLRMFFIWYLNSLKLLTYKLAYKDTTFFPKIEILRLLRARFQRFYTSLTPRAQQKN